jgi:hypothetical protein
MNTPIESPKPLRNDPVSIGKVGRRRFLGASSAAVPVILTMVSQPALGVTCFTPSRALSKNTSVSQIGKDGECFGESPGNYGAQTNPFKNNGDPNPAYNWPIPTSTPFHPTFYMGLVNNQTRFLNSQGASQSMLDVLTISGPGTDPSNVAKHLIAAYLNIKNGWVSPKALTESRCLEIWSEYAQKGYFTPAAGVTWTGAQIVVYLKENGIVK